MDIFVGEKEGIKKERENIKRVLAVTGLFCT